MDLRDKEIEISFVIMAKSIQGVINRPDITRLIEDCRTIQFSVKDLEESE